MTINEYLTNTASITPEVIETQRAELGEKQSAALNACEAYQADITAQNDRIKDQAAKYAEELAKLEALEKKQAATVAQAVAKGDQNKAATAESELDKTTEKIAALKKKHPPFDRSRHKGRTDALRGSQSSHGGHGRAGRLDP